VNWLTDYEKNKEDVSFGWTDKESMAVLTTDGRIVINIEAVIVRAYIHERLHQLRPYASEKAIEDWELEHINRMTVMRIKQLAMRLISKWLNEITGGEK